MSTPSYNPHITTSSPFGVADLPTLFCWRQRMRKLNGEPEEDLQRFMDEHLDRENVLTWAAYRDEELGGYFEAIPGEMNFLADSSVAAVAKVEMVFKREFFKRRPEKENGAGVGGQEITQPALNLVLRDLFDMFEIVFFPLLKQNQPIRHLAASVGAVSIGAPEADESMVLLALTRSEWQRVNASFIAEYEAANPVIYTPVGVPESSDTALEIAE